VNEASIENFKNGDHCLKKEGNQTIEEIQGALQGSKIDSEEEETFDGEAHISNKEISSRSLVIGSKLIRPITATRH
jgi:hypothetical protein